MAAVAQYGDSAAIRMGPPFVAAGLAQKVESEARSDAAEFLCASVSSLW